jgi:O-antigen/teichoic acid export membrane protein
MFLSFQFMPYHLSIANGHNATNVKLGGVCLLLIIPALIVLIPRYGLVGAAIPWLCMNFVAFLILGYVLTQKFLVEEYRKWLLWDTLIPSLVAGITIGIVYLVTIRLSQGYFVILYGCMMAIFAFLLNIAIMQKKYPEIRIRNYMNTFMKK